MGLVSLSNFDRLNLGDGDGLLPYWFRLRLLLDVVSNLVRGFDLMELILFKDERIIVIRGGLLLLMLVLIFDGTELS